MMMVIGDMIRREARIRRQKVAVIEGEREFTYQEVNQRVNRLANALLEKGVAKECCVEDRQGQLKRLYWEEHEMTIRSGA